MPIMRAEFCVERCLECDRQVRAPEDCGERVPDEWRGFEVYTGQRPGHETALACIEHADFYPETIR